ncbi:MAG: hypothetical protein J0L75_17445 [Spirochaetes bacterium]|nr:hypothetical protein [Spirochaetota bacterium]
MSAASPSVASRVEGFRREAAQAAATWYDAKGNWLLDSTPPVTRERFWLAFPLYRSGRHAFADAIIRKGKTKAYGARRFDIFETNIAALLLKLHGEAMADDVREKLESLVEDGFHDFPGNRQIDFQFHGYNDNMPAKATLGLILGGERLGHQGAVAHGRWNLEQFRGLLTRRGIHSEYQSPTYTPLTIHAMAELAEHANDPGIRALSRAIEARLWMDVAARFHPGLGLAVGPHSRAYTVDTLGQATVLGGVLWFLLGERVDPSPMELFRPSPKRVYHHQNDLPFNIAQLCWFTSGNFHLPAPAADLFRKKTFPFRAVATTEIGDWGPDLPAHPCRIETLLERDFAVGTADSNWLGGEQAMPYFVNYRKTNGAGRVENRGTVYTKILVDDDRPGFCRDAGVFGRGEADLVPSQSLVRTIQSGRSVLVATHPQLRLGGGEGLPGRSVARLRELVVFPSHFGGGDALLVGGKKRASWSGPFSVGEWVCSRRGRMYIGIRALVWSIPRRAIAHRLVAEGGYEWIESVFYEGRRRRFTREALRGMHGGFLAEHAGVDDFPSLAAFSAWCATATICDSMWSTRWVRIARPASGKRPALDLELSASAGAPLARFAAVDGKVVDTVTPLSIQGIPNASLPFLGGRVSPSPIGIPWSRFQTVWTSRQGGVGDRAKTGVDRPRFTKP